MGWAGRRFTPTGRSSRSCGCRRSKGAPTMFIDAQALLSDAQAVTADAASTNTYDSGAAGTDITEGEPLGIGISVDVAADFTTGDETYEFHAIQSANANLSSPDVL